MATSGMSGDLNEAVMAVTDERIAQEGQLSTFISVTVACENLVSSRPHINAICILYRFTHQNRWEECGRTEVIQGSLNPQFIKAFQVEYKFEERQKFAVKVYDVQP